MFHIPLAILVFIDWVSSLGPYIWCIYSLGRIFFLILWRLLETMKNGGKKEKRRGDIICPKIRYTKVLSRKLESQQPTMTRKGSF